jgi:hypothetical protein
LQARTPNDQSLEQYQRQLAEAYLRSQIVLQKGDVNAAATALSRARALMPKAPALTGGVNGAITQARKAELEKPKRRCWRPKPSRKPRSSTRRLKAPRLR